MGAQATRKTSPVQLEHAFDTGFGFDLNIRVEARIGEEDDGRNWLKCPFNVNTGVIDIPREHQWGNVETVGQAMRKSKDDLVTALRVTLRLERSKDCLVLVTQRPGNEDYHVVRYETAGGDSIYRLPPTAIRFGKRNKTLQDAEKRGPIMVYTANNRSEGFGTNRTDVIIATEEGKLGLVQLVTFTDDDGKTLRIVALNRWNGQVHRLETPSPYPARMHEPVFTSPEVQALVENVTFVPEGTYPGFDVRAQMLQLPTLRNYLQTNMENFPSAEGKERNYPVRREVPFTMGGKGAIVAFYAPDMGCGGFGIAEQPQEDGTVKKFQIRANCISRMATIDGEQQDISGDNGLLDIQMGDIVVWDQDVLDMGDHPPLIVDARVEYGA
jgi:hypothetical protein